MVTLSHLAPTLVTHAKIDEVDATLFTEQCRIVLCLNNIVIKVQQHLFQQHSKNYCSLSNQQEQAIVLMVVNND